MTTEARKHSRRQGALADRQAYQFRRCLRSSRRCAIRTRLRGLRGAEAVWRRRRRYAQRILGKRRSWCPSCLGSVAVGPGKRKAEAAPKSSLAFDQKQPKCPYRVKCCFLLLSLLRVFPDQSAPVVRMGDEGRGLAPLRRALHRLRRVSRGTRQHANPRRVRVRRGSAAHLLRRKSDSLDIRAEARGGGGNHRPLRLPYHLGKPGCRWSPEGHAGDLRRT